MIFMQLGRGGGPPQPSLCPLAFREPLGDDRLLAYTHTLGGRGISQQLDVMSAATEAGEAPTTAAALANPEPGFRLSIAPPVGVH